MTASTKKRRPVIPKGRQAEFDGLVLALLDAFVALHSSRSATAAMIADTEEKVMADLLADGGGPDPRFAFRDNPTIAVIPACVKASCAMQVAFPDIGDMVIQVCDEEAAAIAAGKRNAPPEGEARSLFG